jgi:hypothetical protein
VVFVSSQQYTGNIGGLEGADAECQSMAADAGVQGTFKAWLGDGTEGPSERFTQDGRFVLVDGTLIAEDWEDLTDGTIVHFIDQTEDGGAPPPTTQHCSSTQVVWTGVYSDGSLPDVVNCVGFTSDADPGMYGRVDATDYHWTYACTVGTCGYAASIYCFEQ